MIEALQNSTSLNFPDPSKPFFVQTDASDVAGAGFQKDNQGYELLMACVSRTFTQAECKYGTFSGAAFHQSTFSSKRLFIEAPFNQNGFSSNLH